MKHDHDRYHRRSIRMKRYDYSQSGAYFVTICTQGRECLFGDVVDGEMRLNYTGIMVKQCWDGVPPFPPCELDEFVVMPNHFHGIIVIVGAPLVGAHYSVAVNNNTGNRAGTRPDPILGDIIGVFKSMTTHQYVNGSDRKIGRHSAVNYGSAIIMNTLHAMKNR